MNHLCAQTFWHIGIGSIYLWLLTTLMIRGVGSIKKNIQRIFAHN